MNNLLIYEEWYDLNEKEIWIELSEIGADRELDFNPESEFEKRYENYLNKNKEDEQNNFYNKGWV
tara:strand:- start:216 stop:410 length:195 start_codon:yes stop_codon:yes gene_type:complete